MDSRSKHRRNDNSHFKTMNRIVISLGSNIKPEKHIQKAKDIIGRQHHILAESAIVKTEPVGFTDQPHFLNGAVLIETKMDCRELNEWLHQVEDRLGRIRGDNKYGPRTIDLDIVVWNGQLIDEDVRKREFLRKSVLEVWPELIL